MLVDAGDGVVSQLLAAGIALESITQIALTHMHWDHILGYPALIWGSWNMGRLALTVTGPMGTRNMHDQLVERYYREQAEWAMELGFPRAGFDDILVRDVAVGWSETIDGCLVQAGPVLHPPMDALAYRFSYSGRSLVVTGDTARCDELVAFCESADVLVIDACAIEPSRICLSNAAHHRAPACIPCEPAGLCGARCRRERAEGRADPSPARRTPCGETVRATPAR